MNIKNENDGDILEIVEITKQLILAKKVVVKNGLVYGFFE